MVNELFSKTEQANDHRLVLIGLVVLMVLIGLMIAVTVIIAGGVAE